MILSRATAPNGMPLLRFPLPGLTMLVCALAPWVSILKVLNLI